MFFMRHSVESNFGFSCHINVLRTYLVILVLCNLFLQRMSDHFTRWLHDKMKFLVPQLTKQEMRWV